jgi:DNA end-binding protein Ku
MSLAVLRVRDDVIVLQTMMWPDEVRTPDFNTVDAGEAKPAEVKMAKMLVETLAGDFEPDEFEDDYRSAVEALVEAKIQGGEVKRTPEARKTSGEVVDLLAALQRSVEAAKSARGETPGQAAQAPDDAADTAEASPEPEEKPARKSAAKKSSAAKAPAKKAPAKKAGAAKTSPRKAAKKAS